MLGPKQITTPAARIANRKTRLTLTTTGQGQSGISHAHHADRHFRFDLVPSENSLLQR